MSAEVLELAENLRPFDSLVQSAVGGNNDTCLTAALDPRTIIGHVKDDGDSPRRVIIAVRLHAALMAIRRGHYVIHLAYERKGYGAFADLGLEPFVHNVYNFDVAKVLQQCHDLRTSRQVREHYDRRINERKTERVAQGEALIRHIRKATPFGAFPSRSTSPDKERR